MTSDKTPRRSQTTQIHPRVSKTLVLELKLQARRRRTSVSNIIEAAVMTFLNQKEHESVIDRQLEKLQDQNGKIKRELQILIETQAAFMKVYLAHTPEIPESQKRAAEENSLRRFERFIALVANTFKDEQLFQEAVEEKILTKEDFGR